MQIVTKDKCQKVIFLILATPKTVFVSITMIGLFLIIISYKESLFLSFKHVSTEKKLENNST